MSAFGDCNQKVPGLGVLLLIPVAILLACCASQQRPDAQQAKEAKAETDAVARDLASIDDARCQSFGFQRGSSRYGQCRRDIIAQRKQMGTTD